MKKRIDWAEANAACEALTENEDSLTREIVMRLAEKWALWAMAELAEANAPMRFSRLMERVEGVSQKSFDEGAAAAGARWAGNARGVCRGASAG